MKYQCKTCHKTYEPHRRQSKNYCSVGCRKVKPKTLRTRGITSKKLRAGHEDT